MLCAVENSSIVSSAKNENEEIVAILLSRTRKRERPHHHIPFSTTNYARNYLIGSKCVLLLIKSLHWNYS